MILEIHDTKKYQSCKILYQMCVRVSGSCCCCTVREVRLLQQDATGLGSGEDSLRFQSQFLNCYICTTSSKRERPQCVCQVKPKGWPVPELCVESTSHLSSADWAGCWQVEGSCKIWPGEPAASRGWCSWSSSCTRQPGGFGRPCDSSHRRLRGKTAAGRGFGTGGEDGEFGGEVGNAVETGGEMGRRKTGSVVVREGEDQTEEWVQTETAGQTGELVTTGCRYYTLCRYTSTGTYIQRGQLCLTTALSTRGSLRGEERRVTEQGSKETGESNHHLML